MSVFADVDDADFLGWLAAADVVVDLRFPHRGEVSGSLARAMQAGKPTVVSATGTYLDIPDDCVLRVAAGPADPSELALRLRTLLEDDELRERMGAAAAAHMRELRDGEATAHGYEHAIERTLELVRDPGKESDGDLGQVPRRRRHLRGDGGRGLRHGVRAGAGELQDIAIGAARASRGPVARLVQPV